MFIIKLNKPSFPSNIFMPDYTIEAGDVEGGVISQPLPLGSK